MCYWGVLPGFEGLSNISFAGGQTIEEDTFLGKKRPIRQVKNIIYQHKMQLKKKKKKKKKKNETRGEGRGEIIVSSNAYDCIK